jgi:hypothetical protein
MLSPEIGRSSRPAPAGATLPGVAARNERGSVSVDDFLARLKEACARGVSPDGVAQALRDCRPSVESLQPWIAFRPDRYARHRLFRGPSYEVLLMCWDRDQDTPIHDHDGQTGWISVIAGSLYIQEYVRTGGPADLKDLVASGAADIETAPGSTPLILGSRRIVSEGESVAEAEGAEVVHRVGPVGGKTLSIHVYAAPVDSFLVFDEVRGSARRFAPSLSAK